MHPLIESLRNLSSAADEALSYLEKHDYHKEADDLRTEKLDLNVIPKQLQEIVNSLMIYCIPLEYNGRQVNKNAILSATNMQLFMENMELSGDRTLLRQFNHIDIEPISEVAEQFKQIGLSKQARLLENATAFADKMRSYSRTQSFKTSTKDKRPIQISFTLSPEELTEEQQHDAQRYKDFTSIFRPGVFSSSQRRALIRCLSVTLIDIGNRQATPYHHHLTNASDKQKILRKTTQRKSEQNSHDSIHLTWITGKHSKKLCNEIAPKECSTIPLQIHRPSRADSLRSR